MTAGRPTGAPDVVDNTGAQRYELRSGADIVAFADYSPTADGFAVTHTEVRPGRRGRGVGTRLAKAVLDDARQRGVKVVPACSFMAVYVRRHPEYSNVVAGPGAGAL